MTDSPHRAGQTPDLNASLEDWLAYIEGLHPTTIDMGLERVREVWQRLGVAISCPVITVAGTNGKGSTCAMLESIYREAGYRTAMYTSPHLVHFMERLRINSEMADATDFIAACADVERARTQKGSEVSLTYFEFTTLAFLVAISRKSLDVAILEIGLGGRLDAVNLIDCDCAIITSIDLDHMEYLGPDRESIGREKAHIMRTGKPAIVSDPMPPQSVIDYAQSIGADLWRMGTDFNFQGDKQQWGWAGRGRRYAGMAYPALRGANQLVNASGVLAALTAMSGQLPVTAQAIRNGMAFVEIPGRFQLIPGQPALVLDVAHNPHSVAALAANLDAMGFYPTTHAVMGAMADKDLTPMFIKLAPLVDRWYFTDLPTPRAASAKQLQERWLSLNTRKDAQSECYTSPQSALDAAINFADAADRIVVFGSFYTVGGVLQNGTPRMQAKHLAK
jgi:dihydrofolate synthase / folylpolyglutamate synthase